MLKQKQAISIVRSYRALLTAQRADQAGADDQRGRTIDQDRHHRLREGTSRSRIDARSLGGNCCCARTRERACHDSETEYSQTTRSDHDHLLRSFDQAGCGAQANACADVADMRPLPGIHHCG
ncbi:hypothetical protein [Bradyrhizobium liaoningense]|uniref:hypothetical protein n=1 Tax=Bradyrhizobium liaoningense TaxID=43992 RepID=UPI001BA4D84F|nr:hypothetical protein [Bradyrhizobium liaoningense]MBR0717166.1 hypothetical protein [Bradyrhizobium liaoningense]